MSLRVAVAGLVLALGISACEKNKNKKEEATAPKPAATVATGTVGKDGVRKVPVEVVKDGYSPDRIAGKPGEKLTLVFTRKVDGHCYEELVVEGKRLALPKDQPVEVAVTVPQEGEVKFACGMDMLTGVVISEKG